MPLAVIDWVNVLGCAKCSLLVFIDCLGWVIGHYTPNFGETGEGDEDESVVNDLYSPVPSASSKLPGVFLVEKGSADIIPGVDSPAVVDIVSKPTGVDMWGSQANPPQVDTVFDDAVFDTAFKDGLKHMHNSTMQLSVMGYSGNVLWAVYSGENLWEAGRIGTCHGWEHPRATRGIDGNKYGGRHFLFDRRTAPYSGWWMDCIGDEETENEGGRDGKS